MADLIVGQGSTVKTDSPPSLGSLSGVVKAATGVLSALPLGSANQKLFIDITGSDLEFAGGSTFCVYTRDVSIDGDQPLIGAGFKPSSAIVICVDSVPGGVTTSIGMGTGPGASQVALCQYASGTWTVVGSFFIYYIITNGATVAAATIKSFDSDGVTLTWSKPNGSPTGTAMFFILYYR
jgi:hypothetical protein